MHVLDIDLDLFVDPRPEDRARYGRLSSNDYRAWSPHEVEKYLTEHCRLRKDSPLPGLVVTNHHDLFDHWKALIDTGHLECPFHLTHIDSHADMGMGDGSCGYIMGELLHHDVSRRVEPKRGDHDGLLEGNYVSFAIACRWISSITYVNHPEMPNDNLGLHDIPNCMFQENDPNCGIVQLKQLPAEFRSGTQHFHEFEPIALEPTLPITLINRDKYFASNSFSFIFAAQSPSYTPAASDRILDVIREFIR